MRRKHCSLKKTIISHTDMSDLEHNGTAIEAKNQIHHWLIYVATQLEFCLYDAENRE